MHVAFAASSWKRLASPALGSEEQFGKHPRFCSFLETTVISAARGSEEQFGKHPLDHSEPVLVVYRSSLSL